MDQSFNRLNILNDDVAKLGKAPFYSQGGGYFGKNIIAHDASILGVLKTDNIVVNDEVRFPTLFDVGDTSLRWKKHMIPDCVDFEPVEMGSIAYPWSKGYFKELHVKDLILDQDKMDIWQIYSFQKVNYKEDQTLNIWSPEILLDVGHYKNIDLRLNGSNIPNNTKVKIYFIGQGNKASHVEYKISLSHGGKQYTFKCQRSKKLKLIFSDSVYCTN